MVCAVVTHLFIVGGSAVARDRAALGSLAIRVGTT